MAGEFKINGFAAQREATDEGPQVASPLAGLTGQFISNIPSGKPIPADGGILYVPPRGFIIGEDGMFYERLADGSTSETPGLNLTADDPDFELETHLQWQYTPDDFAIGGKLIELASYWFDAKEPGWAGNLDELTPVPGVEQQGGTRGMRGPVTGWKIVDVGPPVLWRQYIEETDTYVGDPTETPNLVGATELGVDLLTAPDPSSARNSIDSDTYGAYSAYRDGSTNDRAVLAAANTAAVAAGKPLLLLPGTHLVGSGLTFTARAAFRRGAVIKPANGVTVTMLGGVDAPLLEQIFDLSAGGKVVVKRNAEIYPEWWGAVGEDDEGVDDEAAVNAAWAAASAAYSALGVRQTVVMHGVYPCHDALLPQSNTLIDNTRGHLKFYGGHDVGHFILHQAVQNIEGFGGILDSNEQGNDNTLAFTYLDVEVWPQVPAAGGLCENIYWHDLKIQGARYDPTTGFGAGGPVTDPQWMGTGGGKGITVQNGCKNLRFRGITIDDCDVGFSVESIDVVAGYPDQPGHSREIFFSDMTVQNCRYMGSMFNSNIAQLEDYGSSMGVSMSNIRYVDCAVGQTLEDTPQDVADLFGVICCDGYPMAGVTGKGITFVSTTGKTTVFRGPMRMCDFDFQLYINGDAELRTVVDAGPYLGYLPSTVLSRANVVKGRIFLTGTGPAFAGHLIESTHATAKAANSEYVFSVFNFGNGTPAEMPPALHQDGLPSSSSLLVHDLVSNKTYPYGIAQHRVVADLFMPNATITPTSAGTVTMTIDDTQVQKSTGANTHVYKLPSTGITIGVPYRFINTSTGPVDLQAADGSHIAYLLTSRFIELIPINNTPTVSSDWYLTGVRQRTDTAPLAGMLRDSNGNAFANAFIGVKDTVTAGSSGGTTVLTVASGQVREVVGSTTHNIQLATTLVPAGYACTVIDNATGVVTVKSSNGDTVATLDPGAAAIFQAVADTPTTAAHWKTYAPMVGPSVISLTSSATLAAISGREYVYLLGSGAVPTMPTAVGNTSKYHLKNVHSSDISLLTTSSQTVDVGSLTIRPGQSYTLVSDNANWVII